MVSVAIDGNITKENFIAKYKRKKPIWFFYVVWSFFSDIAGASRFLSYFNNKTKVSSTGNEATSKKSECRILWRLMQRRVWCESKKLMLGFISSINLNRQLITEAATNVFYEEGALKNFTRFTGKHLCQSLFFNKTGSATLLKKRIWHRCFPVNFIKFLRIPFLQNTSGRVLLSLWLG